MDEALEQRRSLAEVERQMRRALDRIEAAAPPRPSAVDLPAAPAVAASEETLPAAPDSELLSELASVDASLHELFVRCSLEPPQAAPPIAAAEEGPIAAAASDDEIAGLYRSIGEASRQGDKAAARRYFRRLRQLQRREAAELEAVYERTLGASLRRGDELIRRADELLQRYAAPASDSSAS